MDEIVMSFGMLAIMCWLIYCFHVQPPSEKSQRNRNTGPSFNPTRQNMLERIALSAIPSEREEFDRIFGRPLYRERNYDHSVREAIMYIAKKEGWHYQLTSDLVGPSKPNYYAGTQSQYTADYLLRRARMLADCTVRQERYMEWYNESRYGQYVPYIFPEQYDCYDDYYNAVMYEYSKM